MTHPPGGNPYLTPLLDAARIEARVAELAAAIAPRLQPGALLVGLLNGACVFTADLLRALGRQGARPQLDFMVLSSYGAATETSGQVKILLDCRTDLTGRQVLVVDDILDTGLTLAFALGHLRQRGTSELLSCVLLDKPARRRPGGAAADFVGFPIPDAFVVGYGIDYAERFRALAEVAVVTDPAAAAAWHDTAPVTPYPMPPLS